MMILLTTSSYAQHEMGDSLFALNEFIHLRQIYNQLPVELKIHIKNSSSQVTEPTDSMEADMEVYYDYHSFYMKAEGLEEIVNDSLIIMVNNPAKSILLYRNNQDIVNSFEKTLVRIIPDSSIDLLAKKYGSSVFASGKDQNEIRLKSRETIYGTAFPKESISVRYRISSHQPVEFRRTRTLLEPVDSASYSGLIKDPAYDGMLVTTSTLRGDVFFFVKELTTSFRFDKIDYNIKSHPVKEEERLIRQPDGSYTVAKGFEEYMITKEF